MADIVHIGGEPKPRGEQPDPHGQAALMLAESILHAMVDAQLISTERALAIVETAQEVKEEVAKDSGEASDTIGESQHLLGQIATSFGSDLQ